MASSAKDRNSVETLQIEKDVFPGLMLAPFHYACFARYPARCGEGFFGSHNWFQIVLGLSGVMNFRLEAEKRTICCAPGDVCILSPGIRHNWRAGSDSTCENFMFFCNGFQDDDSDLGRVLNMKNTALALNIPLPPEEYMFYVGQFRELVRSHDRCGANIMHGLLYAFCGTVCRRALKCYDDLEDGGLHPALNRALELMRRNYRNPVTLRRLAEDSGLGPSRLSELFRRKFGLPPMAYLLKLRTDKAVQLLNYSDMNVSQIAEFLGFRSVQYFSRFLKKQTGSTPCDFLKNRKIV